MNNIFELIIIFILVAFLSYIPIIGPYFKLFNTMIHETGHALAAILSGGRVRSISLFQNTGGLAITSHRGFIGRVFTLLAGYPTASVFSVAYIFALTEGWYTYIAMTLAVILVYNVIFWVRNIIGWVWIVSVLAGLYFLYTNQYWTSFELGLTIIGLMLLMQAFLSAWVVFIISLKDKHEAGDASILANTTKLPAILWGSFFVLQGAGFFILGASVWLGFDIITFVQVNVLH
ncbi:M50 family metallopeptidase [Salipaludibacillus daqingensis]|uniref:M50 family metallopeptidase n=1 Tax=Salipaludibacillus daqingensis TaxID=3041001 RepID=UPI0024757CE0|nr:M50 family metallopeptidase [Salipaludibacillus daqingensis]